MKNHLNLSEYWQVHCCESFLLTGCDCHSASFLVTQVQPATQKLKIYTIRVTIYIKIVYVTNGIQVDCRQTTNPVAAKNQTYR